ncbi:dITPase [Hasllibacter halocynthiae]|uniref:dITP/XTP pyrophosphatase n=1 Tax=Hasllibacter halocynthiae TaxID=595589 RepID=A0A2T0X2F6_9RHOB|nr:non-canonical purine NTP pyrophosphatase [Hasllibacter halocynthiae]PRY93120.1 dITPase [Hasllibacter halocynthiae]
MTRRLAPGRLVIATHNSGKLREIAALLAPHGIEAAGAAALGLAEPAETEGTFEGNARIKALAAASATGLPALSDDSGIEIEALGGAPGVRTADWAETGTGADQSARRDFTAAMARAHDAILAAGAPAPWPARFRATLCLAWPDGHDEIVEGRAEGHFTWPPRGGEGFGFDPVFTPLGHDRTFGEMPPEEKEPLTHRADAFAKLKALLP